MRSLVLALASAAALAPGPARADCGENCTEPFEARLEPRSTRVAADGVLAFFVDHGRADTALEFLTVTVRDAGGAAVAGALAVNAEFSVILWRPEVPWAPGDYTVVTRLDTTAWSTAVHGTPAGFCFVEDHTFEFVVEAAPLPAPTAPPVLVEATYDVRPDDSLAALVCCDGAMPYAYPGPGYCPSEAIGYNDGACTPRQQRGVLGVHHALDVAALSSAAADNFATRLLDGGVDRHSARAVLDAPRCLRFEALDLARGEVYVDERCHGDDIADQLGALPIAPSPEFTGSCAGPMYVCEVDGRRWDETRCATWPDGEPFAPLDPAPTESEGPGEAATDDGCGCTSGRSPAPLLALLLALPRRRRR